MNTRNVRIGDLTTRMEPGFACSKSRHVKNGIPHLRPFNIGRDGQIDLSQVYQIMPADVPNGRGRLETGQILFNNTNSDDLVGKSALIKEPMTAGFSNHMTRIEVNTDCADPAYVAYALDRLWRKGHFKRICTRWVSQSAVNTTALTDVQVALPPLPEQRRIVDILDRAASIRRLRQQAQNTARHIVPALFYKTFGDPMSNPMKWPIHPFGDGVAEIDFGISAPLSNETEPGADKVPVIRMPNIGPFGDLLTDDLRYLKVSNKRRMILSLNKGDLLFNWRNSPKWVGKTTIWDGRMEAIFASFLYRIRLEEDRLSPVYVKTLLNVLRERKFFESKVRQAVSQANFSRDELCSVAIGFPPRDLQNVFVRQVEGIQLLAGRLRASEDALEQTNVILQRRLVA